MDLDPSRLVTCASGWTDQPVGHVLDVHVYPGPTNGGTGNIPLYSGPTNEERQHSMPIQYRTMGKQVTFHIYAGPTNGEQVTFPCIQNQPMGEQVTFHVYPGPTNGGTGTRNIPVYSEPTNRGNR